MADRVTEREKVVVERGDGSTVDNRSNPLATLLIVALVLLVLAFIFGWFGDGDDPDSAAPVQQETQVEVPSPTDTSPDSGGTESDTPPSDPEPTQ